jgi:hypothetical protein
MAKSKVHQKPRAPKARAEKTLLKGRIEAAAERGGVKSKPKGGDEIGFGRATVELMVNQLESAKRLAIEGAIPQRFADSGPEQAIEAYRTIRFVQTSLRRALEGSAS